jgi:hypothetical protein
MSALILFVMEASTWWDSPKPFRCGFLSKKIETLSFNVALSS